MMNHWQYKCRRSEVEFDEFENQRNHFQKNLQRSTCALRR